MAPYSGISGVYLDNHSVLRVYGQLANNTIQEWCCMYSHCSSIFELINVAGVLC